MAQLSLSYPESKIIQEEGSLERGPKVGSRIENISLKSEQGTVQLYDLFYKIDSFMLLLFLPKNFNWEELNELPKIIQKLSLPIKTLVISEDSRPTKSEKSFEFVDSKEFIEYGAENGACYVIRPDSYIRAF